MREAAQPRSWCARRSARSEFSFAVRCNQIRDNAKKFPKAQSITTPSRMIKGDPTRAQRRAYPVRLWHLNAREGGGGGKRVVVFLAAGNVRRGDEEVPDRGAAKRGFQGTVDKCAVRST